jgi:glucose/arabinose dehydrogenase
MSIHRRTWQLEPQHPEGRPSGMAQDVVTGFLNSDNQAHGRPVGLAIDKSGALLIADDVGNTVWRVTSAGH